MKATIKDIARAVGVSPSTVSRALHDNERISPAVRERVKRAAQEMNFHPNLMARSLVSRQSRIIGVVFPPEGMNLRDPFCSEVLQGIGHSAGMHRYQLLLIAGTPDMSAAETCRQAAAEGYVSGVILLSASDHPPAADMPVVTISPSADEEVPPYQLGVNAMNRMLKWLDDAAECPEAMKATLK